MISGSILPFILAGWLFWLMDVKAPYRAELIHSKLSVAEQQIRSIFAFTIATLVTRTRQNSSYLRSNSHSSSSSLQRKLRPHSLLSQLSLSRFHPSSPRTLSYGSLKWRRNSTPVISPTNELGSIAWLPPLLQNSPSKSAISYSHPLRGMPITPLRTSSSNGRPLLSSNSSMLKSSGTGDQRSYSVGCNNSSVTQLGPTWKTPSYESYPLTAAGSTSSTWGYPPHPHQRASCLCMPSATGTRMPPDCPPGVQPYGGAWHHSSLIQLLGITSTHGSQ